MNGSQILCLPSARNPDQRMTVGGNAPINDRCRAQCATSAVGRSATIRQWALSTELSSAAASLPLIANSEHEDRVGLLDVAIQSYVATGFASDDQLPRVCGHGSSNERIVLEYVDCLNDFPDTAKRIFNSALQEMIKDAIEVILDLKSQLDPGHLSEPVS